MRVGIVGSEAVKFTLDGELKARTIIEFLLTRPGVTEVVSGGCHLGGVDLWAEECGNDLKLKVTAFLPAVKSWEGGYKPRNLQIARAADEVHCLTVKSLPVGYTGMRFNRCYHCHTTDHVKSGGCWTMAQAIKLGKVGVLHVIEQAEDR